MQPQTMSQPAVSRGPAATAGLPPTSRAGHEDPRDARAHHQHRLDVSPCLHAGAEDPQRGGVGTGQQVRCQRRGGRGAKGGERRTVQGRGRNTGLPVAVEVEAVDQRQAPFPVARDHVDDLHADTGRRDRRHHEEVVGRAEGHLRAGMEVTQFQGARPECLDARRHVDDGPDGLGVVVGESGQRVGLIGTRTPARSGRGDPGGRSWWRVCGPSPRRW